MIYILLIFSGGVFRHSKVNQIASEMLEWKKKNDGLMSFWLSDVCVLLVNVL